MGENYLAVVKLVILYRPETWVMTPRIERVWGGFHISVARKLMGRQLWRGQDGVWVYLPLEDAMAEDGFQEVDTYIYLRQNTVP